MALFYNWRLLKYPVSHEEIWLPDLAGDFETVDYGGHFERLWCGQCFSSTTRGDANGVRFAPASEVIGKHPERWEYIEVEVDDYRFEVFMDEATRLVGAGYDYWGVFGFLNPFPVQD